MMQNTFMNESLRELFPIQAARVCVKSRRKTNLLSLLFFKVHQCVVVRLRGRLFAGDVLRGMGKTR